MIDKAEKSQYCAMTDRFANFQKELRELINKHSLEDTLEMPDFILAELLVDLLKDMSIAHAQNNSWHERKAYL